MPRLIRGSTRLYRPRLEDSPGTAVTYRRYLGHTAAQCNGDRGSIPRASGLLPAYGTEGDG
jgi:hypothetical protein